MFNKKYAKGTFCPLIKGECVEHECKFWVHLLGEDPQTGKEVDHWDCALAIMPTLTVENIRESRHTAAATESFRNEVVSRAKAPMPQQNYAEITDGRKNQ